MEETVESNIGPHTDIEGFEELDADSLPSQWEWLRRFKKWLKTQIAATVTMERTVESNTGLNTDIQSLEDLYTEWRERERREREEWMQKEKERLLREQQERERRDREQLLMDMIKKEQMIEQGRRRNRVQERLREIWLAERGMKLDGTSIDEPSHRKSKETVRTSTGEPPNKKNSKRNESLESPTTPASVVIFQEIPEASEGTSTGEAKNIKRKRNESFESPHIPSSVVQFQEIPEESVKRTIAMVDRNSADEPPTNNWERNTHGENAHIPASIVNVQDQSQESDGVWQRLSENVENLANNCKKASQKLIKDIPSTVTKMLWEPIFIAMTILTNIAQDVPSTVTTLLWNPITSVMANLTNIVNDVPLTLVERLCNCIDMVIAFAKNTVQDVQLTLIAKLSDSMVNINAFLENIVQESEKIQELITGMIQRAANTTLSEKLLNTLAGLIGEDWESLGLKLGLNDVQIYHIRADHSNTQMAICAMLRKWMNSKSEEAKASDLLLAMWNCKTVTVDWKGLAAVFI